MNHGLMFSIIIPTYNRADLILKTVESYLQQNYLKFEVIVVDDGSTDNTREVLSAIKDDRVAYYYKENSERGAARNYGASLAKGAYINFCDSDDYVYKHHLSVAYKYIEKQSPDVFHLGHHIINKDKIERAENRTGILNEFNLKRNYFILNSIFIKREIALENKFVEDRKLAGSEDWLLWLILSAQYDIIGFGEITSALVQHEGRSMVQVEGAKTLARITLLNKYLEENVSMQTKYEKAIPVVFGSGNLLVALDFALEKNKISSLKYLFKSISYDPAIIFTRRFLAVLKHLILRW
jgi:glycosyltransferase involved in cell wall biosynthesis